LSNEIKQNLESMFIEHGFETFRWIQPSNIITAQWVRMKCVFGCGEYGKTATCPPSVPGVDECRKFFDEYRTAAVFHFQKAVKKPEDRHQWTRRVNRSLIKLERAVLLAGYEKTFLLFMDSCSLCSECPGIRQDCKHPESARPSPEAMAVDVFSTVRALGFPIEVLSEYDQVMNRYAILLIE
jgi:predicted metal-binding protein